MNKNVTHKAPKAPKKKVYSGTGLYGGFLAVLTVMAALVILAAQNTVSVPFSFLVWDLEYPLVAILLATIAGTVFLDEAVGFVWRHRRRKILAERHELKELRTMAAAVAPETVETTVPAQAEAEATLPALAVEPTDEVVRSGSGEVAEK